ncbi:hypothetical protein H8356DRAFT_1013945 [Neocallimastix lanati (nom. inval.)]
MNRHSNIFVLLSPNGIPAYLYSSEIQNSYEIEFILTEWSKCYGIPKEKLYYQDKNCNMPLVITVYIPELDCYINYPTRCIFIIDSKNSFNIGRRLCYNPRIYHQFNKFIWRDQSIHNDTLIFANVNNSIKYENNDIINQIDKINNTIKSKNISVEKIILNELIKEDKIINEIDNESMSVKNNNINGKTSNSNPNTPTNINKANTPYTTIENNTQVEDNYDMPGIFNESNFDDFGDWGTTGIEITDKDFDFFDDKPSQSKTMSDDFGLNGFLSDPIFDNKDINKQSSMDSLSQNTLTDIKMEEKNESNNILPTTLGAQDIGTPSSINININQTINSIHNSPEQISMSPINNIMSPQSVMPTSSPLVNVHSQNSISSASNEVINNSTNDINNSTFINNVSYNTNNSLNNGNNVASPIINEESVNDGDSAIPREWELKSSNYNYFENIIEKYHKGKWSYEPKLSSYIAKNNDINANNKTILHTDTDITTENKISIDFASAWKMLNIPDYNSISNIIEKSLNDMSLRQDLLCNNMNVKIKDRNNDDVSVNVEQEHINLYSVLDRISQKIFIDQYTGSLSSWNKSVSSSLSTITFSEENQLYDEYLIPSLVSKALNQLQVIFEDLFGSDNESKYNMKNIYVEGPLTIKQLYDSEHLQHAKYGKYQVKKKTKKNLDYVLEKLSTPNIIVENNNEWIELSSTSLRFWDKIGVLPYSGKKNISWFALCPTMKEYNGEPNINSDLINIVREWIQSLSYIYESSNFGTHTPGTLKSIKGIIPCLLEDNNINTNSHNNILAIENILNSYEKSISYFASIMGENIHGIIEEGEETTMSEIDECLNNDQKYIVLYLLSPFSSSDKTFIDDNEAKSINYRLCQMFVNSFLYKLALNTRLSIEKLKAKIILQIIPLDLIANNHSFDGYITIGLKDLVFTIYSKCRKLLQKNINVNNSEFLIFNDLYQPSYILSQSAIPIPYFSFEKFSRKNQLKNRINIMEPDRILHIAYINVDNRAIACMTDNIGELFEIIIVDDINERLNSISPLDYNKYTKQQIRFIKIWEKAMKLILFGCNFYWRIAIVKIGHVLQDEVNDWEFISSIYLGKLQHLYNRPALNIINNLNEYIYSVSVLGIYKNSTLQLFKEKIKTNGTNTNPLSRRDSEKLSSSQNSSQSIFKNSSKMDINDLNEIIINLSNSCYTYIHSVQRSPSFPSNPEIIWPLLSSKNNNSLKESLALPLSVGWMIYTPSMESKQVGINTKNFEILLLSHQHCNPGKSSKTCFPTWNPVIPTTPISMPNSPSNNSVNNSKNVNGINPPTLIKSNSISMKDINSPLSMASSSSSLSLNTTTSVPYNVILSDLIKQYFSLSFLEIHWSNLINTANGYASDDIRLPIHISSANRISKILKGFNF